jgi:hypothetical protein
LNSPSSDRFLRRGIKTQVFEAALFTVCGFLLLWFNGSWRFFVDPLLSFDVFLGVVCGWRVLRNLLSVDLVFMKGFVLFACIGGFGKDLDCVFVLLKTLKS